MNRTTTTLLASTLLLTSSQIHAAHDDDFSAHSVDDHAGRYILMDGLGDSRWPDGVVPLYYNPTGAPLSQSDAVAAIEGAAAAWNAAGGVSFQYMGITDQALSNTYDDKVVIGWMDGTNFRATFGDASGYASIWWSGSNIIDGEVVFNIDGGGTDNAADLQGLATHELGHLLGIFHSDVQESVMFANPYNTAEFMRTLRDDDLNALAMLYPATSGNGGDDSTSTGATLAFSGLNDHYAAGDTLDVQLREMGDGTTAGDLWFAIQLPSGALLFVTQGGFSAQPGPLYSSVTIHPDLTFSLMNLSVPSGIGGEYTFYALYTTAGGDPLSGGASVFLSNIATGRVTLGN